MSVGYCWRKLSWLAKVYYIRVHEYNVLRSKLWPVKHVGVTWFALIWCRFPHTVFSFPVLRAPERPQLGSEQQTNASVLHAVVCTMNSETASNNTRLHEHIYYKRALVKMQNIQPADNSLTSALKKTIALYESKLKSVAWNKQELVNTKTNLMRTNSEIKVHHYSVKKNIFLLSLSSQ